MRTRNFSMTLASARSLETGLEPAPPTRGLPLFSRRRSLPAVVLLGLMAFSAVAHLGALKQRTFHCLTVTKPLRQAGCFHRGLQRSEPALVRTSRLHRHLSGGRTHSRLGCRRTPRTDARRARGARKAIRSRSDDVLSHRSAVDDCPRGRCYSSPAAVTARRRFPRTGSTAVARRQGASVAIRYRDDIEPEPQPREHPPATPWFLPARTQKYRVTRPKKVAALSVRAISGSPSRPQYHVRAPIAIASVSIAYSTRSATLASAGASAATRLRATPSVASDHRSDRHNACRNHQENGEARKSEGNMQQHHGPHGGGTQSPTRKPGPRPRCQLAQPQPDDRHYEQAGNHYDNQRPAYARNIIAVWRRQRATEPTHPTSERLALLPSAPMPPEPPCTRRGDVRAVAKLSRQIGCGFRGSSQRVVECL